MSTDIVKGKLTEAKGKVKQAVGKAIDDPELEIEGIAEKTRGKAQQAVGHLKAAARDLRS